MSEQSYDEDLLLNPFYKSLTTKGKPIYTMAASNRWTVLIPRKGTTSRSINTKYQFESHILKPIDDQSYQTLNNKEVRVNGSFIVTTRGFANVNSIEILFEETFFNENEESYHVLCIDHPLEGGAVTSNTVVKRLETLQNCKEFLWPGLSNKKKSLLQSTEMISLFNKTYSRLEAESIRHSIDSANAVFTRVMQICLKESHLRRPSLQNRSFLDNVKLAVETFVMDGLYNRVFKGISAMLANEDAAFNKKTRNLTELQVKYLDINPNICKNFPRSKKILSNITKFTTPLEKLYVLKFTITTLSGSLKTATGDADLITADDLLPALVFLVVKSEIPNWLVNISYIKNFHFSNCKNDEFQFYLSSFEAAIEYVKSGQLDGFILLNKTQRAQVMGNIFNRSESQEKQNTTSPVDVFFEHIRCGNLEEVLKILRESKTTMREMGELMCHPLCSCDTCENMISKKRKDPSAVTVFSRDDYGRTALHQASEYGGEEILYELIKKGAIVNATNYHGNTPLHCACQRGNQKIVVLLSHYGANLNASDNDGNTPLHLAVSNGHEVCVEYLCSKECEYSSKTTLNIDAVNENYDTALHVASRWGFGSLVYLLIRNGASTGIPNKEQNPPLQCALNGKIQEIFSQLKDSSEQLPVRPKESQPNEPSPARTLLEQPTFDQPKTEKQKQEFNKLLKAVSEDNISVVREKLGLTDKLVEEEEKVTDGNVLCHPLCQCKKCLDKQRRALVCETVTLHANMGNCEGVRALHVAALHGYDDIVGMLLNDANADSNVRTAAYRRTPLHLSCQYNNVECVNMLLKKGARTNMRDGNGNSPLHYCCTNGHIGPAILLLQHGANVESSNQRGNTPLHDACRWNFMDLVRLLLYYNAPVKAANKANITPRQYIKEEENMRLFDDMVGDYKDNNISTASKKKARSISIEVDQLSKKNAIFLSHSIKQQLSIPHDNTNSQPQPSVARQHRTTLHDLYEALETEDVKKLHQLSQEIKRFDRKKSLRRVSTIDKSFPNLNMGLEQSVDLSEITQCIQLDEDDNKDVVNKALFTINNEEDDVFDTINNKASEAPEGACAPSKSLKMRDQEDWPLQEIDVDSADEALEGAPTINANDDDADSIVPGHIERLLCDAIQDINVDRRSLSSVDRLLHADDNLFLD